FIDGDVDDAGFLIDGDAAELGGFQRFANEFLRIVAPADDVHFFVVELTDDVFDAGSAHADAGTDGVDLRVVAPDGDFGAEAGFAGDAADFDRAVGDFVDLGLEEAADEVRMAAGKDDFRAA